MDGKSNSIGERKRITEISFLNILLCILVVFIHVSSEPVSSLDKANLSWALCFIPWRLSAFAVQGFLLLSGVKLFLGSRGKILTPYPAFIAKRFRTVFLPYTAWVVVYYIYFLRLGYFEFSLIDLASYIVKGDLVGHFYFVIAIMQFYMLMPLWRRIVNRYSAVSALSAALLVTVVCGQYLPQIIGVFAKDFYFACNDRAFTTYIFYFLCGCYIGSNYESFTDNLTSRKLAVTVSFAVTAVLDGIFSLKVWRGEITAPFLETVHIAYIISAIMFFLMLSASLFSKRERLPKLLAKIDRVSYAVYLAHPLFIFWVNAVFLERFGSLKVRYALRILLTYTAVFGLCLAWGEIKTSIKKVILRRRKGGIYER